MAEPIVIGDANDGRNRRILVLGGLAAALIVAVMVLPGLLFSDGGEDDFEFPPVALGTPTTTELRAAPAETFESFSNKNPFAPLIDLDPAASGGPSTPGQSSPTTTAPPSSGEFTFPEGPSPTFPPDDGDVDEGDFDDGDVDEGTAQPTTTTAPGPPPPPARQPDRVSLLEVFTDQAGRVVASVRVNDVTHQVGESDEFATSYRVLDLNVQTRCGDFLFGDDRFGLCEGDETLK